jgi:DNA-binding HxlR family transcriptional regulator
MKTYGQYCPIARGSEVLAERWTPIILRNLLLGCRTFNEIAGGAPGLSRALLTKRLRDLERAGVIAIQPKPDGHGSNYELTAAGRDLQPVLGALGGWAEKWTDLTHEHSQPDYVLWAWCRAYLRRDLLPESRVLVRFNFPHAGRRVNHWLLIERHEGEVCRTDPGFGDDAVVTVHDPLVFARWHLGWITWAEALKSKGVEIEGPRELCREVPKWNGGPELARKRRAAASSTETMARAN